MTVESCSKISCWCGPCRWVMSCFYPTQTPVLSPIVQVAVNALPISETPTHHRERTWVHNKGIMRYEVSEAKVRQEG